MEKRRFGKPVVILFAGLAIGLLSGCACYVGPEWVGPPYSEVRTGVAVAPAAPPPVYVAPPPVVVAPVPFFFGPPVFVFGGHYGGGYHGHGGHGRH